MADVSPVASRGVTVRSALLWLLTARYFRGNQQRRSVHHLGRQVSSHITFSPPISDTGEFTCIWSARRLLTFHLTAAQLIKPSIIMS